MLKQFYARPSSWARLRLGPLGPYIDAFAQRLSTRSYARSAGRHKIRAVARFNRWLARRQYSVANLDEEIVLAFLSRRRNGLSRREAPSALRMLLSLLRDAGIIRCVPVREETPLHAIEQRFARYLTQVRGLAKPTINNYLPIARTFLSERFGDNQITLDELTPRDITRFIVRHVIRMSPRSAQLVITALRSFFRYLYERGEISTNLVASIPTVANWRMSDLPKFLEPEHAECLLASCNRSVPTGRRDYAPERWYICSSMTWTGSVESSWCGARASGTTGSPSPRTSVRPWPGICAIGLPVRRAAFFSASTRRGKGLPVLPPSVISSDGPLSAPGSIQRAKGPIFCAMASPSKCSAVAPRLRRSARY